MKEAWIKLYDAVQSEMIRAGMPGGASGGVRNAHSYTESNFESKDAIHEKRCLLWGHPSPYISHYLCMIGLFCEPTFFVFCRRAAPWRQQARELLEHFRAAGQRRRNVVSVGLVMMPRGLRVAASRVRWARRGHLPRRQDGWQRAPRLGLQDSPRPSRL